MRHTALSFLLACAACGSSEAPPMTVQDSAGIRIVVSHRPAWGDDALWRISARPLLSVGSVDGDPALTFDRLSGAYLIDPDRIAVLDDGADQVRFFSAEGGPLGTSGRPGEGPGEFRSLELLSLRGDSLWLLDAMQGRVTIMDSRGSVARVARLPVDNVGLGAAGVLTNGSSVVASDLSFSAATGGTLEPGLQRFTAAYVRVDPLGEVPDTILITSGSEVNLQYGSGTVQMMRPLFARSVSHAVLGDRFVQGSQDSYQIVVYRENGALEMLIRRDDVDVRLDEGAYGSAVEERVGAAPEPARPGLRRVYEEMPKPDSRPAHSRFLVDTQGFLWVQDFSYVGEARTWAVFDQEGSWLGTVEFPDRFRPTQVLEDRAAGVWRDELEVEYARVYELFRG